MAVEIIDLDRVRAGADLFRRADLDNVEIGWLPMLAVNCPARPEQDRPDLLPELLVALEEAQLLQRLVTGMGVAVVALEIDLDRKARLGPL